ncbi:craniofacial development protein 2-like [Mytilus trossulus]|uniref:craniofacial development protein 2-like n=1 Tax=Mytilus trossulus TaxID=6551 RepID=UPI00300737D0
MNVSSESRNAANGKKCGLLTPKNVLSIGAWNVRTRYETEKTAQVVNEMRRYYISILGVSECRWLNNGSISTDTGVTIFYSGRTNDKHYEGVALVLSKEAKRALLEWQPVDERRIMARFYSKYSKLSVIQCYAPTNEASVENKNKFYDKLQSLVSKVPAHDLCLIIGDLNAKIGVNNSCKERIMVRHGCGECNENGGLLVDLCGLNDLVIGCSLFPHKDIHKLTWNSPNGRDQNQIDHIIVNGRWRKSLMDVFCQKGSRLWK